MRLRLFESESDVVAHERGSFGVCHGGGCSARKSAMQLQEGTQAMYLLSATMWTNDKVVHTKLVQG